MNILFIGHVPMIPTAGGIERMTVIISKELRTRGHFVAFLSTSSKCNTDCVSGFPQLYINVAGPDAGNKFMSMIKELDIDIIVNQFPDADTLALQKYIQGVVRSIAVIHSRPFPILGLERKAKLLTMPGTLKGHILKLTGILTPGLYRIFINRYYRSLYTRAAELSDKICLLSSKYTDRLLKHAPDIDSRKITIANNPNTFPEIPDIKEWKDREKVVIWVGRLIEPQKNVVGFIDVWNKFHQNNPDWQAKIIGDGPARKAAEEYARKKQASDIEFVGNIVNPEKYYSTARFLCMTSLYEGWPMVLPEAMAYGCVPCAFASFEAIEDIIDNGHSGLLSYSLDPADMADMMSSAATKTEDMGMMAHNATVKIAEFSPERIAGKWIMLFNELLSHHGS